MPRLFPFAVAYLYVLAVAAGLVWRGAWVLAAVALTFVAIPLLDAVSGVSSWNPDASQEERLRTDRRYCLLTWCWLPVGSVMTVWAVSCAANPG